MRVFLTGATGFIGSYLVPELINAGYHVVGLSRSDAGAEALTLAGAEVFRGDVNDLDRLSTAADAADGIIHTAFNPRLLEPEAAQRGGPQDHRDARRGSGRLEPAACHRLRHAPR